MGIYVWGTGCGAGELIAQGLSREQITAFIDNTPSADHFLGRPVIRPDQLSLPDAELVLVTSRHCESICNQALSLGLKKEVLLFLKNHYTLTDRNTSYKTASRLLGPEFVEKIFQTCHVICTPLGSPDTLPPSFLPEQDYVRVKTLELLAGSLKSVPGAAAELGVYKGSFARIINLLFPNRKLYLFDSFEGFDPTEAEREKQAGTCTDAFVEAHKNTAVDRVVNLMPYPDQVIIRQGLFPFSLNGLEDQFALVSLDVDFEDATYDGLVYFWPRLSSGGYLLLHDYNSPTLSGVKKALKRYEADHRIHLPGVPLCDINGTFVVCKP